MEFSPQDDAIIAAKLRKEVVEIHFGDELASRLDGLKEALDTLRKGLKTLRTGLATIRIK